MVGFRVSGVCPALAQSRLLPLNGFALRLRILEPDNPVTKLIAWYRGLSTTRLLVIASAIIVGLLIPLVIEHWHLCMEKGRPYCPCLRGSCISIPYPAEPNK
jgi:hypothetical protein